MKRVRLKSAAEVPASHHASGRLWLPAGAECDMPDEMFDASVHEDLTPPPAAEAAEPLSTTPSPEDAEPATPEAAAAGPSPTP